MEPDEEGECFDCGHCERCIDRAIDYAEELAKETVHCCLECGCDLDPGEDVVCSECDEKLGSEEL